MENSLLTHFVMKHHHTNEAGTGKKDPLLGSFFSYRPSAGAAPRSVPTQQTVYIVAPTSEQFYLFKHHLTGEAWPAWLFSLR